MKPTEWTKHSKLAIGIVMVVAVIVMFLRVTGAQAANQSDPFLDQVASEIAGHQVYIWCENDPAGWATIVASHSFRFVPSGFVLFAQPTIGWLSPEVCVPLHTLLPVVVQPPRADLWNVTWAIVVLLHESTHMKGGIYFDCTYSDLSCEGRTDCAALRAMPAYLPRFGFPQQLTVSVPYTVPSRIAAKHKKPIRRHGKIVRWKRWTTYKTTYVTAYRDEVQPNPAYETMLVYAKQQHDASGVAYPEYKGDC